MKLAIVSGIDIVRSFIQFYTESLGDENLLDNLILSNESCCVLGALLKTYRDIE